MGTGASYQIRAFPPYLQSWQGTSLPSAVTGILLEVFQRKLVLKDMSAQLNMCFITFNSFMSHARINPLFKTLPY